MQWLERLYVEIPAFKPGTIGAYGLALFVAIVATGSRLAIIPVVTGVQYITFYPGVIITTLICGMRAGATTMLLSALAAWFFILPPRYSMAVGSWDQVSGLILFVLTSGCTVFFIGAMRYAIQRYRDLNRTLEQRVRERSEELLSTQQMLSQAQKMEALGQLTGGLAHDFNNMIAIVTGNLDIVRRRLEAGRNDIMRYLDNALKGAQRSTQLTQRLLAFARNQSLDPAVVDVNKLSLGISELLRRTIGETVEVECVLAGGLWRAHIDPNQLESALVNLGVNARDAMPNGGALTVETANVHLDDDYASKHRDVEAGQYVMIAVTDTGVGMSREVVERAIDPFFTTKEPGKGTGLGLSQVYGFVKQSGGHMAIYSEPGRGTTIRLYLPRASADAISDTKRDAVAEEAMPKGRDDEIVLVVEDEDQVREMSATALRELGYTVREAANARDALTEIAENPDIRLLFTDVVMPGMDGGKLANTARQRRPDLKVLFTTGYARNAMVQGGALDPDVAMIPKPFTVEQLAHKLRAVLDGPRPGNRTATTARA